MSGYRLTPENQFDDYGQERIWKMDKQVPRKRKSQLSSSVEVLKNSKDTVLKPCHVFIKFFLKNMIRMY